jgi:hypothetical protein
LSPINIRNLWQVIPVPWNDVSYPQQYIFTNMVM